MNAQRPPGHVPEERGAKHQLANSDVHGIRPSLLENWRHEDISIPTDDECRTQRLDGLQSKANYERITFIE